MKTYMAWFAGVSAAGACLAAHAARPVFTNPDWLARPSGTDVSAVYPIAAQALGIGARVVISCDVAVSGGLEKCEVVETNPKRFGFENAALALAPSFRMRPMTVDEKPVAGGSVRVPILFQLPELEESVWSADEGASPAALTLADGLGIRERLFEAATTIVIKPLQSEPAISDLSEEIRYEIYGHLLKALNAETDKARRRAARAIAARLKEEELVQISAFLASPQAQVFLDDTADAEEKIAQAGEAAGLAAARRALCANAACPVGQDLPGLVRDTADPDPPITIANPVWRRQPTANQIENAAPPLAQIFQIGGEVRLTCAITPGGGLTPCEIASERPEGVGFGKAAQALAPLYQLSNVPVGDRNRRMAAPVFISFTQPVLPNAPAIEKTPPRSDGSMALAKQILADAYPAGRVPQAVHSRIESWRKDEAFAGVTDAGWGTVREALVASHDANRRATAELSAAELTHRMNDQQLNELARFWRSYPGQVWANSMPAIEPELDEIVALSGWALGWTTGAAYCAAHDCLAFTNQESRPTSAATQPPPP